MQRGVVFLAVVLCASQPGECDGGTYVQPRQPSAAPSEVATVSSDPEVRPIQLPEGEAWRRVKSTLGTRVPVLRPTTLPKRLADSLVWLEYAYLAGDEARYRIGYISDTALLTFGAGAVNSAPPTTTKSLEVRGGVGEYSTTTNWPELQVQWAEQSAWSEDEQSATASVIRYSVQARGISEMELLEIVRGLVAVP